MRHEGRSERNVDKWSPCQIHGILLLRNAPAQAERLASVKIHRRMLFSTKTKLMIERNAKRVAVRLYLLCFGFQRGKAERGSQSFAAGAKQPILYLAWC